MGLRGSLPAAPHLRNRRIATGLDLAAWVKHQNAQVSMGFKSTFRMTVEWRNLGHTEIARHCYVWMCLVCENCRVFLCHCSPPISLYQWCVSPSKVLELACKMLEILDTFMKQSCKMPKLCHLFQLGCHHPCHLF